MTLLERMKEDLALLEKAEDEAGRLVAEMKTEIATEACPYKIGHRFHSSGTSGAKQCEIYRITYTNFRPFYDLEIKKVKNNGDLYADSTYFWKGDWDMTEA